MRCHKCKVNNKANANFCLSCGVNLKGKNGLKIKHTIWIILILVIILCLIIFLISSLYTVLNKKAETSSITKSSNRNSYINKLSNINPPKIKSYKSKETISLNKNTTPKKESDNLAALLKYSKKLITGNYVSKSIIVNKLIKLSAVNISRGYSKEVANILNLNIIADADNTQLLKYAIESKLKIYGYGSALKLIENLKYSPVLSNSLHSRLNDMANSIYIDWINNLLNKNKISDALEVYNFAVKNTPASSNLLLLGAIIYLKDNNWQKADKIVNIIKSGNYNIPNGFSSVEKKIKYFRSIENKIVLRFNPGSNYIPAEAILDDDVSQKFIVDTGASLVTIPKSTADKLDLKYTSSNRTRMVATAGGPVYAREVIIRSITINNKTVNNITALILDLPTHGGLGLLGLSYLNNFHLEINNTAGEMILTPK